MKDLMNRMISKIDHAEKNLADDSAFMECVSETLNIFKIEDIELANDLAVSKSTVARWKNGRAIPHPAMRRPVYVVLRRIIQNSISI